MRPCGGPFLQASLTPPRPRENSGRMAAVMRSIVSLVLFLAASASAHAACPALLDVKLSTLTEDAVSLCRYEGKVLLVVNTASQCGYTPQYQGLACSGG